MRWFVALALVVTGISGCGKSTPPDEASQSSTQASASAAAKHPAGDAAAKFMAAVVEGNVDAATAMLTPRAIEQFEAQGKRFTPPGLDTASFEIGRVEQPSDEQALVQCLLKDEGNAATERQEEICCLMRSVEGKWLVAGIAVETGTEDVTILDFENLPPDRPVQAQQPEAQPGTGQPPQTAMQPAENARQ